MKLAWLTDIHLNFIGTHALDRLIAEVRAAKPDAVLIGGDIAEAHDIVRYLEALDAGIALPIYFVLGNHDYYRGSIPRVRREIQQLCARRERLHYLSRTAWVPLTERLALVGHDGWGDAREGDYAHTKVTLSDHTLILELSRIDHATRGERLGDLGDEAAEHIERELRAALDARPEALLLTHVPPWRAACWHQGQLSDAHWTPFFVCKAAGDAIERVMRERPKQKLTVLCGHTHSAGEARPLPNVRVLTGAAEYGAPNLAGVFEGMGMSLGRIGAKLK
jgi:predicted MPP superfamily phosphohydrolase